jgi:hypothetical protein
MKITVLCCHRWLTLSVVAKMNSIKTILEFYQAVKVKDNLGIAKIVYFFSALCSIK